MEIEVGEYVRNKEGLIFRVDKEKKNIQINEFMNMRGERDILNHSKNPIDLIEEGDYVNGVMVESMNNSIKPIPTPQYKNENGEYVDYDESEIKSIVTKQQFKNIEYRLE